MRPNRKPVVVADIRATHKARRKEIRARLDQFQEVLRQASDEQLWEELVFCIFTAGASARMGFRAVEAIRPFLMDGKREDMTLALRTAGAHRFPVERPGYIVVTRNYLREHCDMALREKLRADIVLPRACNKGPLRQDWRGGRGQRSAGWRPARAAGLIGRSRTC